MNAALAPLQEELARRCDHIGRPIRIMEVCGTHTVSIFRSGLRTLLPTSLRLISGPGCPVCVTAQRHIDAALEIASRDGVILATYGDMLRVPGHRGSLETLRAAGARVQVVGSATGALRLARDNPDSTIVFLAVGFETTAPATAVVVRSALREGIENLCILPAHKLVVPAMLALLEAGDVPLDGFLCPGHVSVIIGHEAYRPIVERHGKPCVVAGFEAGQMLLALLHLVRQVQQHDPQLESVYSGIVSPDGNRTAQLLMHEVFMPTSTPWRALGEIPASGLAFTPRYRMFDALHRFAVGLGRDIDNPACRCGDVICGKVEPHQCDLFDRGCTPLTPIGPCMVSGEGTCSTWYKYGRSRAALHTPPHMISADRLLLQEQVDLRSPAPGVRP